MGCCHHDDKPFDGMSDEYKRILWIVIAINGVMFFVEMIAGALANSMALQADALDFFGDTVTYGISLAVIGQSLHRRHQAAIFKAATLILFGMWVLGMTIYRVFVLGVPTVHIMSMTAVLAFTANLISVLLLYRYKSGDANITSVWLCSRNDMIGNVAVMIAAGLVAWTGTKWPDLAVAFLMSSLFCHSAYLILKQIWQEKGKAPKT